MLRSPLNFLALFFILPTLHAYDCPLGPREAFTNDFSFVASSDQGAVGDVVAVELTLASWSPRNDMTSFEAVACYDGAVLELLGEPAYTEHFDNLFWFSQFFPRASESGQQGFSLSGIVRPQVLPTYFPSQQAFPLATVFFRVRGNPGDSTSIRFCDNEFLFTSGPCVQNYLSFRPEDDPDGQGSFVARSNRHLAGNISVLAGEPTRPDPPSVPPAAKVYPEPPNAEAAGIVFESSGAVVQPAAAEVPVELHVTSNYEFSAFAVSLRFPPEHLELARVEEHTRPGALVIDNEAGHLGMFMANSTRRVGAEGERVKIVTLYFNVEGVPADGSDIRLAFEAHGTFLNWLGIRHTGGLNNKELPVTAEVEPLQAASGALRIQSRATGLGDVNLDYDLDLSDPVALLNSLFLGQTLLCPQAADFNEDAAVNITDPVAILNFLFLGGSAPAPREVFCAGA